MKKIEIRNASDVANDISSLVDHITSLSTEDKEWFSKVYFREAIKSQHYAVQYQDELATHVKYVRSQKLLDDAHYIVDWLAGLQEREPKQHKKLARITFEQALGHSKKWHDKLAKQAEKSDRYIEPDSKNAPKALDLGDGWEVFWLKTDAARDIDGDAMGHCVGSGAYDDLVDGEAVFSIRKNNVAHITFHMKQLRIKQAVTKGNKKVPDRYQHMIKQAEAVLSLKLFVDFSLEDTSPIPNGWHENNKGDKIHINNGIVNSDGDQPAVILADGAHYWYKNGKCHRENKPAAIFVSGAQKWYKDGKRHREDGPAVIYSDGSQSWWINDRYHREDGPAVIEANGTQEWWLNDKQYTEEEFNDIIRNEQLYS